MIQPYRDLYLQLLLLFVYERQKDLTEYAYSLLNIESGSGIHLLNLDSHTSYQLCQDKFEMTLLHSNKLVAHFYLLQVILQTGMGQRIYLIMHQLSESLPMLYALPQTHSARY